MGNENIISAERTCILLQPTNCTTDTYRQQPAKECKENISKREHSVFQRTIASSLDEGSGTYIKVLSKDLEGLTLFSQRETIKSPCLVHVQLILQVPQQLLLSLRCLYLPSVTALVSESVTEPETVIVTEPETAIVTGAETATVTEAETAIVTEPETAIVTEPETVIVTATVPETVLVTEPVTVFVIVIQIGSLAPGLRFENPVVQFQEPTVWT